jgi:hypothetical protein
MTDLSEFEEQDTIEHLRQTAQRLQRQLQQAKSRTGELIAAVEQAAMDAAVVVGRPKVVKPKVDRRKGGAEVALIHATDWQVGKVTETYDSQVAQERIERFVERIIKITEIQRAAHPVKRAVLMLGGDMVEGAGIFPGQAHEIDSTVYEQLFLVASMIDGMVRSLAEHFEQVDVWTEFGNHGRIGRKGDHPAHDNIDLIAYRVAEGTTKDVKNASWHVSTNWHQIVEVGAYRALLFHGDEIKSFGGGTPAFGILRKVNSWASGVTEFFVDAYGGHFHTPMSLTMANGGRIFMTGSPESDNQYAKEFVAARGNPSQRLNFVDPERGRVASEYVIWLDDGDA